jgi:PGF-pre-PGF domain-containing protein
MFKNKFWYVFLLLLITSQFLLGYVGSAAASDGNVTVTDDYGVKVSVPSDPQKIVSLSPSNTEILGALDLIDKVVGVTDYSNYPAEAATKTNVGGYTAINSEKVVALNPDLVIADSGNGNETIDYLRGLGLNVVVLNPTDIEGVFKDVVLVGKATGTEDKANSLVNSMSDRVNSIKEKVASANTKPTVAHVVSYDPIYVAGKNTYQDQVISVGGGKNAFSSIDGWGTVNVEDLINKDPDYVMINSGTGMSDENGSNPVYDYFEQNTQVQSLKAVKDDHLALVDADIISRGGPRIVDAIEMVAKLIHPECFSLPISNFSTSVDSGVAPLTVQFTDLSQNATEWKWDFGDGETSTDESPAHIYSAAGTYTANLTVSDENGTSSQTTIINVEESSSSSGGSSGSSGSSSGSGGSAGGSPEPQSNVEAKELSQTTITYGNSVNFDFPQAATPVVNISFDSKKTAGKTTTIVEMLKNQSTLVSSLPSDEIYKFINIWVGNSGFATPDNIDNSVVSFKVEKSWVQDKSIDKSSITLNSYADKKWNALPTDPSGEDDKYLYFSAKTSGFSYFAITGKIAATEAGTEKQSKPEVQSSEQNSKTNVEQPSEQTQSSNTSGKESTKTPGFEMASGIICLISVFLYKRR